MRVKPAQPGDRPRQLKDRCRQLSSGIDADHVVGATSHQEGALESLGVKPGDCAEGGDRGPNAAPLREVHEEIPSPRVNLAVALGSDHVPVGGLVGLSAHAADSSGLGGLGDRRRRRAWCRPSPCYPRRVVGRAVDPRTEDTIVYDLLRTPAGGSEAQVVGQAVFRNGRSRVVATDEIRLAVEEQLARAFVDRVRADERPRGYRRAGRGEVDMLVPGMAEHFIARLRGLWLGYPDGSVVTAREATAEAGATSSPRPEPSDSGAPVTDPAVRRSTLALSDRILNTRPLVRANPPEAARRPEGAPPHRTDCGWIT